MGFSFILFLFLDFFGAIPAFATRFFNFWGAASPRPKN
jgi:hypothetical protein